ncbi:hypothetical protein P3S68_008165 [Capsicum galapagoense]
MIVEGEKLLRVLFGVVSCHQPTIIFVDEIDYLLSQVQQTGPKNLMRLQGEGLLKDSTIHFLSQGILGPT